MTKTVSADSFLSYFLRHPVREDGRSWNNLQGSAMYHGLQLDTAYSSVNAARGASGPIMKQDGFVPALSFHWWGAGYGYVAVTLEDDSARLFSIFSMGKDGWEVPLGPDMGITNMYQIMNQSWHGHYLGWTDNYAGTRLTYDHATDSLSS